MPCLFPSNSKLNEYSAIEIVRQSNILVSTWLKIVYCVNIEQLPEHVAQAVQTLLDVGYSRVNITLTQSSEPGYVWSSQTDS